MKTKFTQEQKQEMIKRYFDGEPVRVIAENSGISRSALYSWINDYKNEAGYKEISLQKINNTIKHTEYLQTMVSLLQEMCTSSTSLQERLCYIEKLSSEYPVNLLCKTFNVAKGTYYNHTLRNKREQ